MPLGDFIKSFLESQVEQRAEKNYGVDWRARKAAEALQARKTEQELEQSAAMAPLNQAKITAQTDDLKSLAQSRMEKARTAIEVQKLKNDAASAKTMADREHILAKIAQLEADQRMKDAQAEYYHNRATNPGAFMQQPPQSFMPGQVNGEPGFVNRRTLEPAPPGSPTPPMPAGMQGAQGMARAAGQAMKRMTELGASPDLTQGPIMGRLSQGKQALMGPEGDEGEFDFLGNQLIDVVYIKSGKQINANEMSVLKRMIPTRARGHIPEQIRLFTRYANILLAKYGGEELPDPDSPATMVPEAPGPAAPPPPRPRHPATPPSQPTPGTTARPTPPPGFEYVEK